MALVGWKQSIFITSQGTPGKAVSCKLKGFIQYTFVRITILQFCYLLWAWSQIYIYSGLTTSVYKNEVVGISGECITKLMWLEDCWIIILCIYTNCMSNSNIKPAEENQLLFWNSSCNCTGMLNSIPMK